MKGFGRFLFCFFVLFTKKVKKEINSVKNEEVKRINEAFTDIIQQHSNQASHFPSSTKSEKMRYTAKYQDESLRFPETGMNVNVNKNI